MPEAERVERPSAPELDAILGEAIPVLDDGFVRPVDYMGTDASIVQAARVSYGAGTKQVSEDRGLIRYLLRHRHTTPFEMCELKLHVRVPMDCWRQWIRHRMASVNEYSTRYSVAIDAAQSTNSDQWRLQSADNKQGSQGTVAEAEVSERLCAREQELQALAREVYEERLAAGVAREQARKDLPLSTYTEAYWKIDLHNLLHFLALRMDSHAQWEIQEFARAIGSIVARWVPATWEAFQDYRFHAQAFSRVEMPILGAIARGDHDEAKRLAEDAGWLKPSKKGGYRRNRERTEFEAKLTAQGVSVPW